MGRKKKSAVQVRDVSPRREPRVFVSSPSSVSHWAAVFAKELKKAGVETWTASENLPAGSSFSQELQRGLRDSDYVVLVLAPDQKDALAPWVAFEIGAALAMQKGIYVVHAGKGRPGLPASLKDLGLAVKSEGDPKKAARRVRATLASAAEGA